MCVFGSTLWLPLPARYISIHRLQNLCLCRVSPGFSTLTKARLPPLQYFHLSCVISCQFWCQESNCLKFLINFLRTNGNFLSLSFSERKYAKADNAGFTSNFHCNASSLVSFLINSKRGSRSIKFLSIIM